jgi:hypothetical protein
MSRPSGDGEGDKRMTELPPITGHLGFGVNGCDLLGVWSCSKSTGLSMPMPEWRLVESYRHSIHSSMALLPIEQRVRHLSVVARTPTTCIASVVGMLDGFSILGVQRTVAMLSAALGGCPTRRATTS